MSVTTETYIGLRRVDGPETCGRPYGTFTRSASRALFSNADFKNGSVTDNRTNDPNMRIGLD